MDKVQCAKSSFYLWWHCRFQGESIMFCYSTYCNFLNFFGWFSHLQMNNYKLDRFRKVCKILGIKFAVPLINMNCNIHEFSPFTLMCFKYQNMWLFHPAWISVYLVHMYTFWKACIFSSYAAGLPLEPPFVGLSSLVSLVFQWCGFWIRWKEKPLQSWLCEYVCVFVTFIVLTLLFFLNSS